jgi:hypothetical protein
MPLNLRERVLTIDRDSMDPRSPFERVLPLDREIVSDIEAFGYDADEMARIDKQFEELDSARKRRRATSNSKNPANIVSVFRRLMKLGSPVSLFPSS